MKRTKIEQCFTLSNNKIIQQHFNIFLNVFKLFLFDYYHLFLHFYKIFSKHLFRTNNKKKNKQ